LSQSALASLLKVTAADVSGWESGRFKPPDANRRGIVALRKKVVYKITYPNGKIYIGKDLTGTFTYMGSASGPHVEKDFTPEQRRNLTIRKEILWESETATDSEVNKKEVELILSHRSNDPAIGYNQWPKFRQTSK
jgi:hypothetical protein